MFKKQKKKWDSEIVSEVTPRITTQESGGLVNLSACDFAVAREHWSAGSRAGLREIERLRAGKRPSPIPPHTSPGSGAPPPESKFPNPIPDIFVL